MCRSRGGLVGAKRARIYHSRHAYSLEGMGLTREGIVAQVQDVFDRFAFPTDGPPPYGRSMLRPPASLQRPGTYIIRPHPASLRL